MDVNKKLEEMVEAVNAMIDAIAKDKSPEIQETVRKLSEVDVKLEHAIAELEKLDANDVETHNDLAKKLDKLLDEVVAEEETPEKEQEPEEPKEPKEPGAIMEYAHAFGNIHKDHKERRKAKKAEKKALKEAAKAEVANEEK